MLAFVAKSAGQMLGIKVTGRLTHADHQQLVPKLEEAIRTHGAVRLLLDLQECQGWDVGAAWDDLKFTLRHAGEVERCAVVGNRRGQEVLAQLAKPFFKKVRYFDRTQGERAWRWVAEGIPASPAPA
ncbi:MAG: STAS/SEC14 domain-containing protein [Gemmataceae bacterium]|nr:STAS/SEC14 domain-containing protein [Gemmataceae bacterium]